MVEREVDGSGISAIGGGGVEKVRLSATRDCRLVGLYGMGNGGDAAPRHRAVCERPSEVAMQRLYVELAAIARPILGGAGEVGSGGLGSEAPCLDILAAATNLVCPEPYLFVGVEGLCACGSTGGGCYCYFTHVVCLRRVWC